MPARSRHMGMPDSRQGFPHTDKPLSIWRKDFEEPYGQAKLTTMPFSFTTGLETGVSCPE